MYHKKTQTTQLRHTKPLYIGNIAYNYERWRIFYKVGLETKYKAVKFITGLNRVRIDANTFYVPMEQLLLDWWGKCLDGELGVINEHDKATTSDNDAMP